MIEEAEKQGKKNPKIPLLLNLLPILVLHYLLQLKVINWCLLCLNQCLRKKKIA